MTDEQLVRAATEGDRDAFAQLVAPRLDRLYAAATLILRDRSRADDALQDALVRAWRDLRSLRDARRLDAWLRRLLVNACRDESRRGRRHESNVRLLPGHDRPIEDDTDRLADSNAIEHGLRSLSVDHRTIIVHHYFLELSLPEIADALGIPIGTAKSRLHHARLALRASIGQELRREGRIA